MGFTLNPLAFIKSEILKYKDKAGKPKAIGAIENVESKLLLIKQFLSRLDVQDVKDIFALLPASVKVKFPIDELDVIATAIADLPDDIDKAEIELKLLETELES